MRKLEKGLGMKLSELLEKRLELAGWVLFVLCAILFVVDSIQSGTVVGLIASILFLLACLVFILPLLVKKVWKDDAAKQMQDKASSQRTQAE
jgi:hypothetical protein